MPQYVLGLLRRTYEPRAHAARRTVPAIPRHIMVGYHSRAAPSWTMVHVADSVPRKVEEGAKKRHVRETTYRGQLLRGCGLDGCFSPVYAEDTLIHGVPPLIELTQTELRGARGMRRPWRLCCRGWTAEEWSAREEHLNPVGLLEPCMGADESRIYPSQSQGNGAVLKRLDTCQGTGIDEVPCYPP